MISGRGALLLISPAKQGQPYRLRYYQLDEGKGRLLGLVPLSNAVVVESTDTGTWAFAISGTDPSTNQPVIFAGDVNAIQLGWRMLPTLNFPWSLFPFASAVRPRVFRR